MKHLNTEDSKETQGKADLNGTNISHEIIIFVTMPNKDCF